MYNFQKGDHIWVGRGKIKHHAIVIRDEQANGLVEIIEYGAFGADGQKKRMIGLGKDAGEVRRRTVYVRGTHERWFHVEYPIDHPSLRQPDQVVQAAFFILQQNLLLPPYHIVHCNCECVARWCKWGSFSSGQADDFYGSLRKHGTESSPKVAAVSPISGLAVWAAGVFAEIRHDKAGSRWGKTQSVLDLQFELYKKNKKKKKNCRAQDEPKEEIEVVWE